MNREGREKRFTIYKLFMHYVAFSTVSSFFSLYSVQSKIYYGASIYHVYKWTNDSPGALKVLKTDKGQVDGVSRGKSEHRRAGDGASGLRIELSAIRNYRPVEAWMASSLANQGGIRKTLDEVPESRLHSFPSDPVSQPYRTCHRRRELSAAVRVYHRVSCREPCRVWWPGLVNPNFSFAHRRKVVGVFREFTYSAAFLSFPQRRWVGARIDRARSIDIARLTVTINFLLQDVASWPFTPGKRRWRRKMLFITSKRSAGWVDSSRSILNFIPIRVT